jgi:hypothetical protein
MKHENEVKGRREEEKTTNKIQKKISLSGRVKSEKRKFLIVKIS